MTLLTISRPWRSCKPARSREPAQRTVLEAEKVFFWRIMFDYSGRFSCYTPPKAVSNVHIAQSTGNSRAHSLGDA